MSKVSYTKTIVSALGVLVGSILAGCGPQELTDGEKAALQERFDQNRDGCIEKTEFQGPNIYFAKDGNGNLEVYNNEIIDPVLVLGPSDEPDCNVVIDGIYFPEYSKQIESPIAFEGN